MRKLAFLAVGALALPLAVSLPAAAQQNNAKPSSPPAAQQQSQSQPMQSNELSQANLSSDQIKQVQQALDQKGFKSGRADGKLGPETKQALEGFQKSQGLQVTGEPDQQTLAKLGIGGAQTTGQGPANHNGGAANGQMQNQPSGQNGSMPRQNQNQKQNK